MKRKMTNFKKLEGILDTLIKTIECDSYNNLMQLWYEGKTDSTTEIKRQQILTGTFEILDICKR